MNNISNQYNRNDTIARIEFMASFKASYDGSYPVMSWGNYGWGLSSRRNSRSGQYTDGGQPLSNVIPLTK
ncbi:hypothetical protein VFPFJ_05328 [Purpureocillium lilacinum]|uniref:Uncharacterized protein n=1 Tax=Purpureocillium lilacinum TaxID=33203 RepID=A0A179H4N9_PURLI|nr:hypothetical protein VFPFJ_05328 [Purpureocillium lilacinum]OAQ84379.1 hypothetical protein VFPBJ_03147 [Purpureocillium lilacinum]OAQ91169.1 hypothetical protein VFPFJ_05328 [Purpureocillium lilacinum]